MLTAKNSPESNISPAIFQAEPSTTLNSMKVPVLPAAEIPADATNAGSRSAAHEERWHERFEVFAPYLLVAYTMGVGLMLARFGMSIVSSTRLRRTLQPITDSNLVKIIAEQTSRLGLRQLPVVSLCERVSVPVVVGIIKPMILFPPALLCGLDPHQLAAILRHEMAHIRRYDLVVNLLQRIVEAFLFFHPVTWWMSRRISMERENCCDDMAAGTRRFEYAAALLRMAEQCAKQRGLNIASQLESLAADGGDGSQLSYRIRRLLGEADSPRVSVTRNALAAFMLPAFFVGMAVIAIAQTDRKPRATDAREVEASRTPGDRASVATSGADEKVEPWEISRLYEADFLRNYLQDHEVLPKPIIVPPVRGKVLDPDGKPVSGVSIVSHTPRQWVDLDATLALEPHNSGGVRKSMQDGTFGLPKRTEPYRVLLVHESGVANVSHEDLLRANGVVTLQEWASITGTLKLAGKPQADETIILNFDTLPWSYSRGGPRLTTTHRTTTDKAGNFSFDRVPPLGGIALHISRDRLLAHRAVYQCESGKNTLIEIGAGNTETLTLPHDHDHHHVKVNLEGQPADKPQLPRLIVRTIDSDGKPVRAGVLFYDRNSHRAAQKQEFERVSKQTDDSGVADFGVIPNSFGCLQLTSSNNGLAECYAIISTTMTKCTQAKPPRANVQTEIKDGILTVTFTMTPHVDLEFNIVDDATNEIVFWSEIFYQDPATNRWWQLALVDGSQLQHNFIPISPQITRETIRISALGYETKVLRLPDELDRSQPIRRDIRLKPMPNVELRVFLPDGTPAEKTKLTFHYPNELDCLQDHELRSDVQGIVTTEFPPNADIGIFHFEHTGGTAELSMTELLDDVKQNPGQVIQRSIQLTKSKKHNNAVIEKAVTSGDHTEKPASWIPGRPQKTKVSGGSFSILDDHSVRLEGNVTWQEVTTYFAFDEPTTVDEVRLELFPVDSPSGPQLGRGGEELILSEVTARLEKQTGKPTIHEFSSCISLLNPEEDLTIHCIDFLSDTGWIVPALPADAEAHSLVLRFDEPVTLQPDERLVLSVDSGGAQKFAVLNRIRFSFHQASH
ncbi:MAG: M56 family metallopeptidase [Planctomycetaceae bacterium]